VLATRSAKTEATTRRREGIGRRERGEEEEGRENGEEGREEGREGGTGQHLCRGLLTPSSLCPEWASLRALSAMEGERSVRGKERVW
jgi:hypothetical protein